MEVFSALFILKSGRGAEIKIRLGSQNEKSGWGAKTKNPAGEPKSGWGAKKYLVGEPKTSGWGAKKSGWGAIFLHWLAGKSGWGAKKNLVGEPNLTLLTVQTVHILMQIMI